jgi:hypothetical protein
MRDQVGVAGDVLQSKHLSNPDMHPGPQRPDHLALDTGQLAEQRAGHRTQPVEGVAYSDKSYDFSQYADLDKVVTRHVEEAAESYAGNVEIRSDQYGPSMRGQTVSIKKVIIVYDATFVKAEGMQRVIRAVVARESAMYGVKIEVAFK